MKKKNFLSNTDFNTNYKKRPFDSYKNLVDSLDQETKKKLDRQRQWGMLAVVGIVLIMIIVLAVTGIGIDKNNSATGNLFADLEKITIECFGDSITEGYTVLDDGTSMIVETSYPDELNTKLPELFGNDGNKYRFDELEVNNYGQSGSILQEKSYTRLSGEADIVLILYCANNFLTGSEYEGMLESNVEAILSQGSMIFLLNYPVKEGSSYETKMSQCNNYIASVSKEYNIQLIDVNNYFSELTDYDQDDIFAADEDHLTETGYILMGDYISDVLHEYYYNMY